MNGKIVKDQVMAAKVMLSCEMEATVIPLLKKLKAADTDPPQTAHLINILETNLQHLVESYGCVSNLATVYQRLTPVEMLVASMVRQGLPTQIIAKTLNIASGTVSIHRKHIRKKLGLDSKSINLCSYLLSLTE